MRYFDADTVFNPWWKLGRIIQPWDVQRHLGSADPRVLTYISAQEVVLAILGFLGANLLIRILAVGTMLAMFFCCYVLAKRLAPQAGTLGCAIVAFFYASNPYTIGLMHDGYFGLLVQYALLPAAVLLIEIGHLRRQPTYLSIVAILFWATGLYNIPLILIDAAVITTLQFEKIRDLLSIDRRANLILLAALGLNAFWLFPNLVGVLLHSFGAYTAETSGDISSTSQFSGLTNVLLLISNPSMWAFSNGANECTACGFYQSPLFLLCMLTLSALAVYGIFKAQRWPLLALLGLLIALGTALHYADDIIGIPYRVLAEAPFLGSIFRGAVKFSEGSAFIYALGLLYLLNTTKRPKVALAMVAFASVVVSLPLTAGWIIEHSAAQNTGTHAFPNFAVQIPASYANVAHVLENRHTAGAVLLQPNSPYAKYSWGAYGNDFVPAMLGRPTLGTEDRPQPNPGVDFDLRMFADPRFDATSAQAVMAVLRIGAVLVHRDGDAPTHSASFYGTEIYRDRNLSLLVPRMAPFPLFQTAPTPVAVYGGSESVARYAALTTTAATLGNAPVCPSTVPMGYADPTILHEITFELPTACAGTVEYSLSTLGRGGPPRLWVSPMKQGRCDAWTSVTLRSLQRNTSTYTGESSQYGGGTCLRVLVKNGTLGAITLGTANVRDYRAMPLIPAFSNVHFGQLFSAENKAHTIVVNQPFDTSWIGLLLSHHSVHVIRPNIVNTYSMAWTVPPAASLFVINILYIAYFVGIAATLIAAVTIVRGLRIWGTRPENASAAPYPTSAPEPGNA